ncbi:MAG: tetratricopeptide repeat protein [Eubacteriales bacterium]
MTLIVARLIDDKIIIVGDSKRIYSHKCIEHYDQNQLTKGIIKSIILSDYICLNFAGNIKYLERAIAEINANQIIEDIVKILEKVSYNAISKNEEAQFILAYYDGECKLLEIKHNETNKISAGWVGDYEGFRKFQEASLLNINVQSDGTDCYIKLRRLPDDFTDKQCDLYSKMIESMSTVIDEDCVDKVGGFVIPVIFSEGKFKYTSYLNIFRGPIKENEMGENIKFTTNEDGGFSANLASSIDNNIAVYMFQGKLGIVFCREINGLMLPTIYNNIDELDFFYIAFTKYNIEPTCLLFSSVSSYIKKAESNFNINEDKTSYFLEKAIKMAEKEFEKKHGQIVSEDMLQEYCSKLNKIDRENYSKCYYNLGVSQSKLGKKEDAINSINKSLKINPDFEQAKRMLFILSN